MVQVLYCENGGNDSAMALVFEVCFADASIVPLLLQLRADLSYEINGVTSLELKDMSLLRLAGIRGPCPRYFEKYHNQSTLFHFVPPATGRDGRPSTLRRKRVTPL